MKILLVGKFDLGMGGPATVVNNLKNKLKDDVNYKIETLNLSKINNLLLILKVLFSKKFKNNLFKYDIIHMHELWDPTIIFLCFKAQHLGIPYFFTFHGVLNKWSMNKNNLQKKVFLFLFSRFILNISQAFHFLNVAEYHEARTLSKKFNNRSFVLSNGIDLPEIEQKKNLTEDNKLQLLFFGRKHPKKGIYDLIEAFKLIKADNLNIELKIVGPRSDYENYLLSKIKEFKLGDFIRFEDAIYRYDEKIKLFSKSDYFILPSYDEADSVAIKESISFGVPIIITKNCKFVEPEKFNLGFTITHNSNEIYKVIKNLKNYEKSYGDKSLSCLNYAKKNFDLSKTINSYKDITKEIITGVKYSDNWL